LIDTFVESQLYGFNNIKSSLKDIDKKAVPEANGENNSEADKEAEE